MDFNQQGSRFAHSSFELLPWDLLDFSSISNMWNISFKEQTVSEFVLAGVCYVMHKCHILVTARLCVGDACQTGEFESNSVASLAPRKGEKLGQFRRN